MNYALEQSDAAVDPTNRYRTIDGYYVQSQFVFGQFDASAGCGHHARVFELDRQATKPTPRPGLSR